MHRLVVFCAVFCCAFISSAIAYSAQGKANLKFHGSVSMNKIEPSASSEVSLEFRQGPEEDEDFDKQIRGSISPARVPSAHVPKPADKALSSSSVTGFNGLTHADQRLASNGNQFSIEPPDQGLAVGNGYVVEAVNLAIRVRSTSGSVLVPAKGLNEFFNLAPAIVRSTPPVYGPFISDPKCYYDQDAKRWFVTVLEIDTNPATGDLLRKSAVMMAVSRTADPTGEWNIYSFDTTNNTGTPDHPGCPCFGDQPLIGADANGFYISTNEFPIIGDGFNGAQVYAISKSKLAAGPPNLPVVVSFSGIPLAESLAYTLQPAITAAGGPHASINGGTEYFLSALDFTATLDNRIAVWALTNTSSLNSATPQLRLQSAVLDSQVYGQPPDAQQRPGPLPLADLIFSGALGKPVREHLPLIAANDDRMQQVMFAAGKLWSSLNTVVKPLNGTVQVGAAFFVVTPSWTGTTLGGTISQQGYVSRSGHSILFPSVGVNKNGKAIIAFSIVGDDLYPSVAYAPIESTGAGSIQVVAPGAAPADGFTGYVSQTGSRTERWGDYSAAVADLDGSIWFANEYIPNLPRTTLANWGTFIGKVAP